MFYRFHAPAAEESLFSGWQARTSIANDFHDAATFPPLLSWEVRGEGPVLAGMSTTQLRPPEVAHACGARVLFSLEWPRDIVFSSEYGQAAFGHANQMKVFLCRGHQVFMAEAVFFPGYTQSTCLDYLANMTLASAKFSAHLYLGPLVA